MWEVFSLPRILDGVQKRADELFDTAHYQIEFTGTTVTFLEGSAFIISGLKQSILWAFLLIAVCMLYLFRSMRILFCSLLPNVIPLVITAGVMGWAGVPLKPSTVLVFSIALGIAIDITIRFLVNYKQDQLYRAAVVRDYCDQNHSFHRYQYCLYFPGADCGICYFLFQRIWRNTGTGMADFAYTGDGDTYEPDIFTGFTNCD